MRVRVASWPLITTEESFKLPKLKPGHIADTYEATEGTITRLDPSKLIEKKQEVLANRLKKIDDPLLLRMQKKQEVRTVISKLFFDIDSWERLAQLQSSSLKSAPQGSFMLIARLPALSKHSLPPHRRCYRPLMIPIPNLY